VDKRIAELNIEHFSELLAKETDEAKRKILRELLVEEKAKLAAIEERRDTKSTKSG